MDILRELNKKQKQAVTHKDGPLLVIAGPGTGKTKVITHRIAYLIRQCAVKPANILAITFTNKAAQEMQERVNSEIGEPHASNVQVCTFHSFCVRLLREHASEINLSENFTIFDQEIQDELLTEAVRELNLSAYDYPPWLLRNIISDAKATLQVPTEVTNIERSLQAQIAITDRWNGASLDMSTRVTDISSVIQIYCDKLAVHNALDFDDLLVKTVFLLERIPSVQEIYQEAIRYILVDEYHDVNSVQYNLLELLCPPPTGNLMVVADEDQAIYSWRGSNPQYVERFKLAFTPQIVELDDHYRCSEKILRAAEEVIAKNAERENRHTLKTHKDTGRDIFHYTFREATEEAQGIIQVIRKLITQRNYSYRDIAVFYRTHRLADVLEEQLRQENIEYQRIRSKNTFQKKDSSAILSYLNFVQWQIARDLELAINFPEKRIDDLTWVRLKWLAQRKEIGLIQLLENIEDYQQDVGPLTRKNISQFWLDIGELRTYARAQGRENITKIVRKLFDILELRRSPYRNEELELIEKQPDAPHLSIGRDVLYRAIDGNEKIQITACYGIDEYCAAHIIHQALETYLNRTVDVQFLPEGGGTPQSIEHGVHILIGDFAELNKPETASHVLLIGTVNSPLPGQSSKEEAETARFVQLNAVSQIRSLTALKLCQRLVGRFETPNMAEMVIYDLETTGVNPKNANIVELAARRLSVLGDEVERFYRLVKPPGGYIPKASTRIHGIDEHTVKDAPSIETVLPEFSGFIQDRILIGHNVAEFDNLILDRTLQTYLKQRLQNPHYDTLATARKLYPRQRCSLAALAEKFGIACSSFHNALQDVETNQKIFKQLIAVDSQKRMLKSLTEFLPFVGLGALSKVNFQNDTTSKTLTEVEAFLNAAKRLALTHDSLKHVAELLPLESTEKERVSAFIEELSREEVTSTHEDTVWQQLRAQFMNAVLHFESQNATPLSQQAAIDEHRLINFLDYLKLMTSSDEKDEGREQLTLMTLHAAKGTEFPVVIIVGMEEGSFPMWKQNMTAEEIEEERRLFYVGMTRAQQQLYLTSTVYRFDDRERLSSRFIRELPSNSINKWSSII